MERAPLYKSAEKGVKSVNTSIKGSLITRVDYVCRVILILILFYLLIQPNVDSVFVYLSGEKNHSYIMVIVAKLSFSTDR